MDSDVQDVVHHQIATWVCQTTYTTDDQLDEQQLNHGEVEATVVLATACVHLQSGIHMTEPCRTLLDTGAQMGLISRDCVEQLKLPAIRCRREVNGIAGSEILTSKVRVFIHPISRNGYSLRVDLYVIENCLGIMPSVELPTVVPEGISMADPSFRIPAKVHLLLGADIWAHIQGDKIYRHADGTILQETALGYICYGRVVINEISADKFNFHILQNNEVDPLIELMQKFWRIEETHELEQTLSAEEEAVEQYFQQSHYRTHEGRYVVQIPLKPNALPIGDTRNIALRRFQQLERRLQREPELKERYIDFMREYEQLNHMRVATRPPRAGHTVYIPHHAVTKKFRVVFDASCLNVDGIHFNKMQMNCPKLQLDLHDQLLCFRKNRIAFMADVTKMFRQVLIDSSQWDLQRIFWREEPHKPLKEYWLTTVTYGVASSVYNSVRAMIQCARDNAEQFPLASKTIEKCFYVDDGLMGAATIAEAIDLAKQVNVVLKRGGFVLRNWASNSKSVLTEMAGRIDTEMVDLNEDEETKVLGLRWLTKTDEMTISVNTADIYEVNTKRKMLSLIAGLYDPTGFIAPIVVTAKILMQDLWKRENLNWDSKLPQDILKRWIEFAEGLETLKQFKIPRWLNSNGISIVQLHGFADASMNAYGAVMYVRTIEVSGRISCILFCAKSRVAPIKLLSIPRLELAAAELLSKLMNRVMATCEMADKRYFLWTDSSIVLHWIMKEPSVLKTYVANRINRIQMQTKKHAWQHVSSEHNPADILSRGMPSAEFIKNKLWMNGPEWLSQPEQNWPKQKIILSQAIKEQIANESKPINVQINLITQPIMFRGSDDTLLQSISDWRKLTRITGYVLRFVGNIRAKNAKRKRENKSKWKIYTGRYIFYEEIQRAANYWIKIAQTLHYRAEIQAFKIKDDKLPAKSKILSLKPFLDNDGMLRAGGRIDHARCTYNKRHPIIVPQKSKVAELIIMQAHKDTLHGGVQLMMAHIRNNYWITRLRSESRMIIAKCVHCIRQAGLTSQQIMADLPMDRLRPARPFVKCGVDMAGPFNVRATDNSLTNTRSRAILDQNLKGYIVVFVCLVTRAVHLEPVMALSAEAFIRAYKRFVSTRGASEYIYSDHGTNFVRADKDFREAINTWKSTEVQDYIAWNGTQWKFITPAAPHQGGIWEAAVKQMKRHLKRVIGPERYSYEALSTLLKEIEACLNSRPICAMSDDPDDIEALTPAHFLIGEPLRLPLPPRHEVPNKMAIGLFRELQSRLTSFWDKWSNDYLATLMNRPKWKEVQENIKIGQLVLIRNENIAPTYWPMGRIIELKHSDDGRVRSVRIKTHSGELSRPIQKLIVLPIDQELEEYN